MTALAGSELLLRQISKDNYDAGKKHISSTAFEPRPEDYGHLSVDRRAIWSERESFEHFRANHDQPAEGTLAVSVDECCNLGLGAFSSPIPANPSHASIDFSSLPSKSQRKKYAKRVRGKAVARGWVFPESLKQQPLMSDD